MKVKKSIQLTTEPLQELITQGESIDFRLDEAAWQELEAGDHIEFWEDFTGWQQAPREDSRRVIVRIEHIYRAPNFQDLFAQIEQDTRRLGDKTKLLAGLRDWWSEDREVATGVLAFHVMVV